ncbi:MAG TPA: winged helix-turn-helix domain-containing protein [Edaphobacter sp.]|jgi:TolB-like protein|nr:winged helix-turn-helix domain-containing protein [Edaphobacter sp.]
MTVDKPQWIRFGIYELNIAERIILRKGVRLRLQDKPFALLVLLLENSGQLVDRNELRRTLWPTGTNVDFEHGIRVAMHKLRTALDETAESPRFIETVPSHGYRFIAPITQYQSKVQIDCPVVIVLPIIGLAPAKELGHVADGFTEELTAQLSNAKPRQLSVIGRTTAMCYKGASKSIATIGNEIGVDYVLEGSIRSHQNILRLTAQLIRVSDQSHLWTASVQGDGSNPVEAQIDLSEQIVSSLTAYLFPGESSSLQTTLALPSDAEALHQFRQGGRFRRYRRRVSSIPRATSRLVHRLFDPTTKRLRRFRAKARRLV